MINLILLSIISLFLLMNLSIFKVYSGELEEVERRVYNIEKKMNGKIPVLPVDSDLLNLSGYLSGKYSLLNGEGYQEGKSNHTARGQHLAHSLILSGNISDNTRYLFAPIFFYYDNIDNINSANRKNLTSSAIVVPRAYGIYEINHHFNIQGGRFISPAGNYLETWDWVSDHLLMPVYLNSSPGRPILYNHVTDGLNIYGITPLENIKVKYYFYGGYSSYLAPRDIVDNKIYQIYNRAYPQKFFWGTRLKLSFLDDLIKLGFNFQSGTRISYYKTYGVDLAVNYKQYGIKIEYAISEEDDVSDYSDSTTIVNNMALGVSTNNLALIETTNNDVIKYVESRLDSKKNSLYIEPFYRIFSKWTIAGRYEYFNPRVFTLLNGSAVDIYTLGIIYDPLPSFRLRFLAQKFDYRKKVSVGLFDEGLKNNPSAIALFNDDIKQLDYNKIDPDYIIYHLSFTLNF